jgi:hypothetical protein
MIKHPRQFLPRSFSMRTKVFGIFVCSLFLNIACGPVPPPPPPQPPPVPAERFVRFTVRGETGHAPAGTVAAVLDDSGHGYPCTIVDDRASCLLDGNIPQGDPAHPEAILAGGHRTLGAAPEYDLFTDNFGFNGLSQDLGDVQLTPAFHQLTRLVGEGQHLRGIDGSRFSIIENTDFNLAGLVAAGVDISDVLDQRAAIGFNVLRVFTAYDVCPDGNGCQPIGRLWPREHPDLYSRILPSLVGQASRRNMRIELVAFTGQYPFFANDDEKVGHWEALKAFACTRPGNIILELVNEGDHPANQDIPYDRLTPPVCGLMVSHGSATQDSEPMQPFWSIVTFHPAASEWWRKTGHNAMELWNGPSYSNEVTRFPDNDSNCQHAYDSGAGDALLSAGGNYHSVEGKRSALLTGVTLECARSFVSGSLSVPLDCQDGGYINYGDVSSEGLLRKYGRGGEARCIVPIRP